MANPSRSLVSIGGGITDKSIETGLMWPSSRLQAFVGSRLWSQTFVSIVTDIVWFNTCVSLFDMSFLIPLKVKLPKQSG